jgi:hypothetical protein
MAFLKETERSLRLYFIVVGTIATLLALGMLGNARKVPGEATSGIVIMAIWFRVLAHLLLGPAFVIAGVTLKRALESGAAGTKKLVKLAAAVVIAEVVLVAVGTSSVGTSDDSAELMGRAMGRALIPLLILWYIYASLRRLSAEAQQRTLDTIARKFD